jgi:hypothetical protein
MEIKDLFYIVGIISTLILSLITLYLNLRNRRNSLREHLYKEQISFFSILFVEINRLNLELDNLMNDPSKRNKNNYQEIIEGIGNIVYHKEFLIPDEIANRVLELIVQGNSFYFSFLITNESEINKQYAEYYKKQSSIILYIKEFIGTNNLSDENKNLHTKSVLFENIKMRTIISELTREIIIKM